MSRSDYGRREVETCKSVLIELVHVLGEFKEQMVIIGGWVPALLFPQAEKPHVGSLDIDVALDFVRIPADSYQTLLASLSKNGYRQDSNQPFRFFRTVEMPGDFDAMIEVDLMAGEYGGTGKARRTQPIQDARARKARGCDLAFWKPVVVRIEGKRPGGGRDSASS